MPKIYIVFINIEERENKPSFLNLQILNRTKTRLIKIEEEIIMWTNSMQSPVMMQRPAFNYGNFGNYGSYGMNAPYPYFSNTNNINTNISNIYNNNFYPTTGFTRPQPMFQGQYLGGTSQMYSPTAMFQGQFLGGGFSSAMPSYQSNNNVYSGNNQMSSLMSYINYLVNFLSGKTSGSNLLNNSNLPYEEEIIIEEDLQGAWGDPHFNFRDKTGNKVTIDHKSTKNGKTYYGETYNILNADGLDIDAEYKKHTDPNNPQVMGAVRVNAGTQELILHEGKTLLEGKELKAGTKQRLKDGRTLIIGQNGNVTVNTKDGQGRIDIKYNGIHYDIDPAAEKGINFNPEGVLGFLWSKGKTMTKQQILATYDTNKNGMLDSADKNLERVFKSKKDIGLIKNSY